MTATETEKGIEAEEGREARKRAGTQAETEVGTGVLIELEMAGPGRAGAALQGPGGTSVLVMASNWDVLENKDNSAGRPRTGRKGRAGGRETGVGIGVMRNSNTGGSNSRGTGEREQPGDTRSNKRSRLVGGRILSRIALCHSGFDASLGSTVERVAVQ